MAKDGNGATMMRIAGGLLLVRMSAILAAQLSDAKDVRKMVVVGANANARQDATISAISETNRRIEHKIDRIFEILRSRGGVPESP